MQAGEFQGLTEEQVLAKVGPLFTADQKKSGILASVSMAQFILESGYGKSELALGANNCFGMKKSLSGNTWSEVQKDCIHLWEKGVRMNAVDDAEKMLFLVLSPDSTQVELFFSEEEMPNEILERRGLPAGGYVWNVEDDDTKNVRLEDGRWTVSQRGRLIYRQAEEAAGN